jgi:hypothetical protein
MRGVPLQRARDPAVAHYALHVLVRHQFPLSGVLVADAMRKLLPHRPATALHATLLLLVQPPMRYSFLLLLFLPFLLLLLLLLQQLLLLLLPPPIPLPCLLFCCCCFSSPSLFPSFLISSRFDCFCKICMVSSLMFFLCVCLVAPYQVRSQS